jgi:hypothetical protein
VAVAGREATIKMLEAFSPKSVVGKNTTADAVK